MTSISTFVFLDLETTGFPWEEGNMTQITELSLIAVKKDHIVNCNLSQPRVQFKLTLCFRPTLQINRRVTEITDLSNDLLKDENVFDSNNARIIKDFLDMLTPPICLVGHNGCGFDFPIFRAELNKANIELSDSILCIDSLQMFRNILQNQENVISNEMISLTSELDGFDNFNLTYNDIEQIDELEKKYTSDSRSVINLSPGKKSSSNCSDLSNSNSQFERFQKQKRRSYKLKDIYQDLYGIAPVDCHRAENDTSILMDCCVATVSDFIEWSEQHCIKFNRIPMMEPGKRFQLCYVKL